MARTRRRGPVPQRPPFHHACERGNVEEVLSLLQQQPAAGHRRHEEVVNMRDEANGGESPLHLATEQGHVAVVQLLLEHGANVLARDNKGIMPVAYAPYRAHAERDALRQLFEDYGAGSVLQGEDLLQASREGDLERVQGILESTTSTFTTAAATASNTASNKANAEHQDQKGAQESLALLLNFQDSSGSTALLNACERGHYAVAHFLLDQGADWTVSGVRGVMPLGFSSKILEGQELSSVEDAHKVLHQVVRQGELYPQLQLAIRDEDFVTAQTLLDQQGAWTDPVGVIRDSDDENIAFAPLEMTVQQNNIPLVKLLIQYGADVNFHAPLLITFREQQWEIFQLLMKTDHVHANISDLCSRSALHYATEMGNLEMTRLLLEKGADVHQKTDGSNGGHTALHYVCICPRSKQTSIVELVELLLQKGSDPNAKDFDDNRTPLHRMANANRDICLNWHQDRGTELQDNENYRDDYDTTMHMVRLLIQHGADLEADMNITEWEEEEEEEIDIQRGARTPLSVAIDRRNYNVAKALVHHGANVNVRHYGMPILHLVCRGGICSRGQRTYDLVRLMLENGANVHARCSDRVETAIHCACRAGHFKVVNLLLSHGANLLDTNRYGETCEELAQEGQYYDELFDERPPNTSLIVPCVAATVQLIVACLAGNVNLIELLCSPKNDYFANVKTSDGQYILHHVCRLGMVQTADHLIAKGADTITKRDSDGKTPMEVAQEAGMTEIAERTQDRAGNAVSLSSDRIIRKLFETIDHGGYGIDQIQQMIDQTDLDVDCIKDRYWNDRTLLYAAATYGDSECARFLTEYGANVNICNSLGSTPLHASARCSMEVTKLLIDNGASVETRDKFGNTPLHVASSSHQAGATKLLLEHGANLFVPNGSGIDPVTLSGTKTWTNTQDLLRAAQEGKMESIERMLSDEQNIFVQLKVPDTDAMTLSWQSFLTQSVAFVSACRMGNLDLVENYSRLDIFSQKEFPETSGEYLLHGVCRLGSLHAARKIVEKYPATNVDITRKDGKTALVLAAKFGHLEIVKWLIRDLGANLLLADMFDNTFLHHACREGHLEIVQFFVSQTSQANNLLGFQNWMGETPGGTAAKYGKTDIESFLAGLKTSRTV